VSASASARTAGDGDAPASVSRADGISACTRGHTWRTNQSAPSMFGP
jgi:hypothetical protein